MGEREGAGGRKGEREMCSVILLLQFFYDEHHLPVLTFVMSKGAEGSSGTVACLLDVVALGGLVDLRACTHGILL